MRALVQRVSRAAVRVDGEVIGEIGPGLLVLLGVAQGDDEAQLEWLVGKVARMRIFADEQGKLNRSVVDCAGEVLVVSQFTLCASTAKGNRPSFIQAATPDLAAVLYEKFARRMEELTETKVATGRFGADMAVELVNEGPLTIWVDSLERR